VPNFIKIDVEGAEYSVLKGASHILKNVNGLMVEISRNEKGVLNLLASLGFKLVGAVTISRNYFFVKED